MTHEQLNRERAGVDGMNINEFRSEALKFRRYPPEAGRYYTVLGLVGEIGELQQLIRDELNIPLEMYRKRLALEAGDILWYLIMWEYETNGTVIREEFPKSHPLSRDALSDLYYMAAIIAQHEKRNIRGDAAYPPLLLPIKRGLNAWLTVVDESRYSHTQVMQMNIVKLTNRASNNTIVGMGER